MFDRPTFTLVASFRDAPGALFNGKDFKANMGKQHIVKVAAGEHNSAALTDLGKLYVWGADNKGQLGLGCTAQAEKSMFDAWDDYTNFVDMPSPQSTGANQVSLSFSVSLSFFYFLHPPPTTHTHAHI